jgi:hypothetical protein
MLASFVVNLARDTGVVCGGIVCICEGGWAGGVGEGGRPPGVRLKWLAQTELEKGVGGNG